MKLRSLMAVMFVSGAAHAQSFGCDTPESQQLDFWVGDWELTHVQDGKTVKSANRVTRILDGCAVLEEFTGGAETRLDGRSVSTFDRATRRWKQTWVDNTGAYLDFDGGVIDGEMQFRRDVKRDGKAFTMRMVWKDVQRDSLRWLWQRSDDGGRTWATQWEIAYRRK